jgi:hypothetical protein
MVPSSRNKMTRALPPCADAGGKIQLLKGFRSEQP